MSSEIKNQRNLENATKLKAVARALGGGLEAVQIYQGNRYTKVTVGLCAILCNWKIGRPENEVSLTMHLACWIFASI